MNVGSGQRLTSASSMTLWHPVHSINDPDFPSLGPNWPVEWYEGAPIFPRDNIPVAQTLCIRKNDEGTRAHHVQST